MMFLKECKEEYIPDSDGCTSRQESLTSVQGSRVLQREPELRDVFRSSSLSDAERLRHTPGAHLRNIWEILLAGMKRAGGSSSPCCTTVKGSARASWLSYQEIEQAATRLGRSMLLPLPPLGHVSADEQPSGVNDMMSYDAANETGECLCPWQRFVQAFSSYTSLHSQTSMTPPETRSGAGAGHDHNGTVDPSVQPSTGVFTAEALNRLASKAGKYRYQYRYPAARKWRAIGLLLDGSNRIESFQLLLGATAFNITLIVFAHDLSYEDVVAVAQTAQLTTIVGSPTKVRGLLKYLSGDGNPRTSTLKNVIVFGSITAKEKHSTAEELKIRVLSWVNFLDMSRTCRMTPTPATGDNVALLIAAKNEAFVDSGASTLKAAAVITQRNLLANIAALYELGDTAGSRLGCLFSKPLYYSYLSLAFPLDIIFCLTTLYSGGCICFATESYTGFPADPFSTQTTTALLTEIQACKPNFLVAYPHFMTSLHRHFHLSETFLKQGFREKKFKSTINDAVKRFAEGKPVKLNSLMHSWLFKKYRQLFGPNLARLFVSYGTQPDVFHTVNVVTGVPIVTFYGEQRTTGVALLNVSTKPVGNTNEFNTLVSSMELQRMQSSLVSPLCCHGPAVSPVDFVAAPDVSGQITPIDNDGWLNSQRKATLTESSIRLEESDGTVSSIPKLLHEVLVVSQCFKAKGKDKLQIVLEQEAVQTWIGKNLKKKPPPAVEEFVKQELNRVGIIEYEIVPMQDEQIKIN